MIPVVPSTFNRWQQHTYTFMISRLHNFIAFFSCCIISILGGSGVQEIRNTNRMIDGSLPAQKLINVATAFHSQYAFSLCSTLADYNNFSNLPLTYCFPFWPSYFFLLTEWRPLPNAVMIYMSEAHTLGYQDFVTLCMGGGGSFEKMECEIPGFFFRMKF